MFPAKCRSCFSNPPPFLNEQLWPSSGRGEGGLDEIEQVLRRRGAGGVLLMLLQLQLRPTPWGEIADVVTRCLLITAAAAAHDGDDDGDDDDESTAAAVSHTPQ